MENTPAAIGRRRDREEYEGSCSPSLNERESRLGSGLSETFVPRDPRNKRQRITTSSGPRRTQPRRSRSRSQEGPSTHVSQTKRFLSSELGSPGVPISSLDSPSSEIFGDLQSPTHTSEHGLSNEQRQAFSFVTFAELTLKLISRPSNLVDTTNKSDLPAASVDEAIYGSDARSADPVQSAPFSTEEPIGEENPVHSTSSERQSLNDNEGNEKTGGGEENKAEGQISAENRQSLAAPSDSETKEPPMYLFRGDEDEIKDTHDFGVDNIQEAQNMRPYDGKDVYISTSRILWSNVPSGTIRTHIRKRHMQRELSTFAVPILNRGLSAKEERAHLPGKRAKIISEIIFHPPFPKRKPFKRSCLRSKITLDQHQEEIEKVKEAQQMFALKEGAKTRENTPERTKSASQETNPEQPAVEEEEVNECEVSYDEEYKKDKAPERMIQVAKPSMADSFHGERVYETVPYSSRFCEIEDNIYVISEASGKKRKSKRKSKKLRCKDMPLRLLFRMKKLEWEKRELGSYKLDIPYKGKTLKITVGNDIAREVALELLLSPDNKDNLDKMYYEQYGDDGVDGQDAGGSSVGEKNDGDAGRDKAHARVTVDMEVQTDEDLKNGYSNDVHENSIDDEDDEEFETDFDEVESDSKTLTADEAFDIWWNAIVPPMLRTTNPELFKALNDRTLKDYPESKPKLVDVPTKSSERRITRSKYVPDDIMNDRNAYNAFLDFHATQSSELITRRIRAIEGYLAPMREEAAEFARETRNLHLELLRKAKEAKEAKEAEERSHSTQLTMNAEQGHLNNSG